MIGKQLRKLRHERDLKQADVAAFLGITRTAYTYYENDKRQPAADMLIALADYFQVSIDYLNGRTCYPGVTPRKNSAEELLLTRYRQVDPRGKGAIAGSARYEAWLAAGGVGEDPGTCGFSPDDPFSEG